jgi:hypothetical protein
MRPAVRALRPGDGPQRTPRTDDGLPCAQIEPRAYPCPSPDGRRRLFQSNRGGSAQLYLMNVDGSRLYACEFVQADGYETGDLVWLPVARSVAALPTLRPRARMP